MSPDQLGELRAFFSSEFEKLHAEFGLLREEVRAEIGELREEVGMLRDELHEFEGHVAQHFTKVERRLDSLEQTLHLERIRREEMQSQLERVAEGVRSGAEELDRFRGEAREEFASVRQEMNGGFASIRTDMSERFDSVDARLNRLEAA